MRRLAVVSDDTRHASTSGRRSSGADVELAVAEPVDPQHLGVDPVGLVAGSGTMPGSRASGSTGGPSSARSTPLHRWAAAGREDVAPGERGARRLELVARVGQLDGPFGAAGDGDGRRQQAVVRPDEDPGAAGDLDGDGPAGGPHTRIDDGDHHALGDVGDGAGQRQRTAADVERPDAVGEVDRRGVRREVTEHRLDDADELVLPARSR